MCWKDDRVYVLRNKDVKGSNRCAHSVQTKGKMEACKLELLLKFAMYDVQRQPEFSSRKPRHLGSGNSLWNRVSEDLWTNATVAWLNG